MADKDIEGDRRVSAGVSHGFDDHRLSPESRARGHSDHIGSELPEQRPVRRIQNVMLVAVDLATAEVVLPVAAALGRGSSREEQDQEREKRQNASAGSAISVSAPASIFRRSEPVSGMTWLAKKRAVTSLAS